MVISDSYFGFIPVKYGTHRTVQLADLRVRVTGMSKRFRTLEKSVIFTMPETEIGEKTEKFDELLLNAVNETLKHVFKEAGAKVIYNFIKNYSHLKREEIAEKPEVFSAGLERLLASAAPVIENLILKSMYRKLELKFEEKEGYGFSDYIRELRDGGFERQHNLPRVR